MSRTIWRGMAVPVPLRFLSTPNFFIGPPVRNSDAGKALANKLFASVAHYPRSDAMITIELTIDGKNSPGLMYVNMPVFFGPERLARFSNRQSFLRCDDF